MIETPTTSEKWFTCDLPRAEFKTFLRRDDLHGFVYFGLWLVLLVASGALAVSLYPTWWALPAFILYGVIYTGNNPRWHECSHGTAFKTDWLNGFFYWFCGSMELRDMTDFRWSHTRHHSFTIRTGVDPEIPASRPPNMTAFFMDFLYLWNGLLALKNLIFHSIGIVSKKAADYVPPDEYKRLFRDARLVLIPHVIALALSIWFRTWIPVLIWGLPRFYGGFVIWTFIVQQHAGLDRDVNDHRLTTRSFRFGPLFSFFVMHMENHIEHHLYPLVPFHALPALHRRVEKELPVPYRGLCASFFEMISVLFKQFKDPEICIKRSVPAIQIPTPSTESGVNQ